MRNKNHPSKWVEVAGAVPNRAWSFSPSTTSICTCS